MKMQTSRLRSLLVTYSFEDRDCYGIRAIVPRAIPLNPPFHPATFQYKIQVPPDVEDLSFDAPHCPDTHIEIAGNIGLKYGLNVVKLMLTNLRTGERVDYVVRVERKRDHGLLLKFAAVGVFASALVIGSVWTARRSPKRRRQSSERLDGISYWRRKSVALKKAD